MNKDKFEIMAFMHICKHRKQVSNGMFNCNIDPEGVPRRCTIWNCPHGVVTKLITVKGTQDLYVCPECGGHAFQIVIRKRHSKDRFLLFECISCRFLTLAGNNRYRRKVKP